jgi:hypothetical protein
MQSLNLHGLFGRRNKRWERLTAFDLYVRLLY